VLNFKNKAVPLHGMKAFVGRKGRAPTSFTSALDAGEWLWSRFTPGANGAGASWAAVMVWTQSLRENLFVSARDRSTVVNP
jgi:hypothetical protein